MDTKQKYVRLKQYGEVIIFPTIIEHSKFRHLGVISAGFCYVDGDAKEVRCFGESISLDLESDPKEDTLKATQQLFGIDAMLKLI